MTTTDVVAGLDLNQKALDEQNRFERLVGPEWYRLIKGVLRRDCLVGIVGYAYPDKVYGFGPGRSVC